MLNKLVKKENRKFIGGLLGGTKGGSSQSTQKTIPSWLEPTVKSIVSRAEDLSKQPYVPYTGQRVADFSADQTDAFQLLRDSVGQNSGLFDEAQGLASDLGQGLTQDQIQGFISPYQQNVTDIEKRERLEDFDQARTSLLSRLAQSRAFGGDRAAILESQLNERAEQDLQDIQARGTRDAYNNAIQTANQSNQTRASGLQALLSTAASRQGQSLADIKALLGTGALQQAQGQAGLDIDYDMFREEQDFPYKQIDFLSNTTSPILSDLTSSQTTQSSGGGSGSTLGNLVGLASSVAGFFKEGGRVPEPRKYGLGGLIKGLSSGQGFVDMIKNLDGDADDFDMRGLVGGNLHSLLAKLGLGGLTAPLFTAISGDDRTYLDNGDYIRWNERKKRDDVVWGEPGHERGFAEGGKVKRYAIPEDFDSASVALAQIKAMLNRKDYKQAAADAINVSDAMGDSGLYLDYLTGGDVPHVEAQALINRILGDDAPDYKKFKANSEIRKLLDVPTYAEGGSIIDRILHPPSPLEKVQGLLTGENMTDKAHNSLKKRVGLADDATTGVIPLGDIPEEDIPTGLTNTDVAELEAALQDPPTMPKSVLARSAPALEEAPAAEDSLSKLLEGAYSEKQKVDEETKESKRGNRALLRMGIAMLANQNEGLDFVEQWANGLDAFDKTEEELRVEERKQGADKLATVLELLKLRAELGDKESLKQYRQLMAQAALTRANRPYSGSRSNPMKDVAKETYKTWLANEGMDLPIEEQTKKANQIFGAFGVDATAPDVDIMSELMDSGFDSSLPAE